MEIINDKKYYQKELTSNVPLYHQPWWLDSVCKNWDIIVLRDKEKVVLTCPIPYNGKTIVPPPYTQFLGPHFHQEEYLTNPSKYYQSIEKVIEAYPDFDFFNQKTSTKITNWLPWHWKDFSQTTRYTYKIKNLSNFSLVESNFKDTLKRNIKNAEKEFTVSNFDDAELFYEIFSEKFKAGKNTDVIPKKPLIELINQSIEHQQGKLYFSEKDGKAEAGIFVCHDKDTAYYIAGGIRISCNHNGALSLLFYETLKDYSKTHQAFDFEGSMIKGVERYFRSFGAEIHPYFEISKNRSLVSKTKSAIKTLLK